MNISKYILASIAAVTVATAVSAQSVIKGKITDTHGAAVSFAFISAQKSDSTKQSVAQKIADSAGNYQLEIKSKGNYVLQVSAVGYEEATKAVSLTSDEMRADIALEKADKNLKDVTVTTKVPMVERKIDRLVMNVDNNPLTTGKSSMETLQLAPGIVIYNNQIMLNGMPISRVMVNGKMLQLRGTDLSNYLNSLRSDDIKSIEIMAHPPAEYDAEGSGGLINIVLKRNAQAGLNGSVYANYLQGKYAGTNEGVQLNFKQGKVGLFANYNFDKEGGFQYLNQSRPIGTNGIYTAEDSAKNHQKSNNIHGGITYDITDRQYLAVDYTGSFNTNGQNYYDISQITYPQTPDNNSYSTGLFPNDYLGRYNNVGLNYHWQTDSLGSTLTVLADYTHNYNSMPNSAINATTAGGTTTDTAYKNTTSSSSKIFTAEAKYLQKFNAVSNLSFGAKISSTDIYNKADFQYQSPFGSDWLNSNDQNYVYDYIENITAGYVNYQGRIWKTDVQAGLRGENTNYTGKLTDTAYTKNGRNYFGLFPSIFLKRNLDSAGNHSLSFNYSRRISRPSFWDLSPYTVYVDQYTLGAGNPYLQPEYDNSFELSYTFKNKYVLTANYTHGGDIINSIIRPVTANSEIMMQQPANSGTMNKWMVSAYLPINIAKWWTTQEYIEYDNTHVVNPGAYDIQKNLISVNINMQFTIAKDFTATLHAYGYNRFIFSNVVFGSGWQVDAGLEKKFFKQRLTLKASMDHIFNTMTMNGTAYYTDFNMHITSIGQWSWRQFTLGATYNFNVGKMFKSHNIESSSQDEKSRLK